MLAIKFKNRKIVTRARGDGYIVTVPQEWITTYGLKGKTVGCELIQEGDLVLKRHADEN